MMAVAEPGLRLMNPLDIERKLGAKKGPLSFVPHFEGHVVSLRLGQPVPDEHGQGFGGFLLGSLQPGELGVFVVHDQSAAIAGVEIVTGQSVLPGCAKYANPSIQRYVPCAGLPCSRLKRAAGRRGCAPARPNGHSRPSFETDQRGSAPFLSLARIDMPGSKLNP